ncbi:hypothetical protein [Fusobacterium varium]|uniref:hypothetical protein n=1 Tax=Fusobacterium varium TaxID=856 RepID=UPI003565E177
MADLDKNELERMIDKITEVENPEVYAKEETHLNKPIKNIKFGHILNINWDNLVNTFKIIKIFFKETVLKQDVDNKNTAGKIVQRNLDKSIEVGDIYCSSTVKTEGTIPEGAGLPYKNPKNGEIEWTNNMEAVRKHTGTISLDDMNAVEKVDVNGSFNIYGGSRSITLNEKAKKYKVLMIKAGGTDSDIHFLIMIPGQRIISRDGTRYGGGSISALWNGELQVTVNHYPGPKDGYTGRVEGVWGLI